MGGTSLIPDVTNVSLDTSPVRISATAFTVTASGSITNLAFPAGIKAGLYNIMISNESGSNTVSFVKLTVATPAPTVTNVTPASIANSGPQTLSITGAGFYGGTTSVQGISAGVPDIVSINLSAAGVTIPVSSYSVYSDSSIGNVIVPAGYPQGSYNVLVTNSAGTAGSTLNNTSTASVSSGVMLTTAASLPSVSSVSPNSGSRGPRGEVHRRAGNVPGRHA